MRDVLSGQTRFSTTVQNLFPQIRKNICGKTCAYFPKYVYVFAEIRLRFCGNKFENGAERPFRHVHERACRRAVRIAVGKICVGML